MFGINFLKRWVLNEQVALEIQTLHDISSFETQCAHIKTEISKG